MSTAIAPKAGCEWYASQCGWSLRAGSLMVEGTSDVSYFMHCSKLYEAQYGLKLVGVDLAVFAAGQGDDGGTFGISEKFPTLFNLAKLDMDATGKTRFRTIALLDDDRMGRRAASGISQGHRQIREYESLFRLRRIMPHRAGSVQKLEEKTKEANSAFGALECTIEDLLADSFCTRFISGMPNAIARAATSAGGVSHRDWTTDGKRALRLEVIRTGTLADMQGMVDVLRALRTYLGLPANGC